MTSGVNPYVGVGRQIKGKPGKGTKLRGKAAKRKEDATQLG